MKYRFAPTSWLFIVLSAIVLNMTCSAQNVGFIEQRGQFTNIDGKVNSEILYAFTEGPLRVQLRRTGFSYEMWKVINPTSTQAGPVNDIKTLPTEYSIHRVDIEILNGSPNTTVLEGEQLADMLNYYPTADISEGITNIQQYGHVMFLDILPGVDLTHSVQTDHKGNRPKYAFNLSPGTSIDNIRLSVTGADSVQLNGDKMMIHTPVGIIEEDIPHSWTTNGKRQYPINVIWKRFLDGTYGFKSNDPINPEHSVVIDPAPSLAWGTYYGGAGVDETYRVVASPTGDTYIAGTTSSNTFIATSGTHSSTFSGATDIYLAKLGGYSGIRQWGTYYGSTGGEATWDLAFGANDAIYIAAAINSDAGLLRFDDQGQLVWTRIIAGTGTERAQGVAVGPSGEIALCGITYSTDFPTTSGAHSTTNAGNGDGFLTTYDSTGTILFSTYLGGNQYDGAFSAAIDNSGNIAVSGMTASASGIATPGTYISTFQGAQDAFLMKFLPSGTLHWGTYIGTNSSETTYTLRHLFPSGFIIAGSTGSTDPSGMISIGSSFWGDDPFCALIDYSGALQWGRVYRATGSEYAIDVSPNAAGEMTMVGYGYHGIQDSFPGGSTATCNTGTESFAYHLDQSDGSVLWSRCISGSGDQYATGVQHLNNQEILICGTANDYLSDLPAGAGTQQGAMQGGPWEGFLLKLVDPTILPVEMLYVEAINSGPTVTISWATASEQNTAYFSVERSTSPTSNFESIGTRPAAGNSQQTLQYELYDEDPVLGTAYYRIKSVDSDASTGLSKVVSVTREATIDQSHLHIFPNPTSDRFSIFKDPAAKGKLDLIDPVGKIVRSWPLEDAMEFSVHGIPVGLYWVRYTADGKHRIGKIMIAK